MEKCFLGFISQYISLVLESFPFSFSVILLDNFVKKSNSANCEENFSCQKAFQNMYFIIMNHKIVTIQTLPERYFLFLVFS